MDQQALQKLLIEMDNQLNKSRAELQMCYLQLDRVDTNLHLISKTRASLKKQCSDDETVWQGVGKAFLAIDAKDYLGGLADDEKEFNESKKSLNIKRNYLETTLEKTAQSMNQIVGNKR
ncbi:prefoldin subunit 1, component of a chaperone [Scheffersomyces coipomensis]|uniref:prefoldin subunit 1, component of a chaperone n=1 Tax=Scheffersomyces coipomensis TaxID=1788519 RepID=UPI00315C565D